MFRQKGSKIDELQKYFSNIIKHIREFQADSTRNGKCSGNNKEF
jgi:hypothetical protein